MIRTTLKDVAEAACVSVMTVSLVMRKQGKISPATRAKVLEAANTLGYRPDPVLSALVEYRSHRQPRSYRSTVAFLTNFPSEDLWRQREYVSQYYAGACSRAAELGYSISAIWMREPGMTPGRLAGILEARGIKGVLVAPIEEENSAVELDWDRFCAVSLCRNLVRPRINTVDHNHRLSIEMAVEQIIARGYRRPGLVTLLTAEAMNDWVLTSTLAMLRKRHKGKFDGTVPDLLLDSWDYSRLKKWVDKHRPDVLISQFGYPYIWMLEEKIPVPQRLGFLHLESTERTGTTGICQRFQDVGITAMDLLHLELLRDESGIPKIRKSIDIDGHWIEGHTLRGIGQSLNKKNQKNTRPPIYS